MTDADMQARIEIVAAATRDDVQWLTDLWHREWGGDMVVSRGQIHRIAEVDVLIATDDHERIGAAAYHLEGDCCELVSINALTPAKGIGSRLLKAVERTAVDAGCRRIWLITTNDNVDALRFYQRRGYRLARLYPGAIEKSRQLKPTIPLTGDYGIPIRDEIELEKLLDTGSNNIPL